MKWFEWDPAQYSQELTLGEMLELMPQSPIKEMPLIITTLENPSSFFHLPGPAAIEVHDVIHCILLRGLRAQDEAFVIGFTMGAAKDASAADRILFRNIADAFYPPPYDFSKEDFKVYDIAYDLGLNNEVKDLHQIDADEYNLLSWADASLRVKLDVVDLVAAYELELDLRIDNKASERLRETVSTLKTFMS